MSEAEQMGNQLGMSGAEQQVGKSDLAGRQVMILGHRKTRSKHEKKPPALLECTIQG